MAATIQDDESIIGDECHIIARRPDWSRGDASISEQELDDYPNLILLCKVHHKVVDDQLNTYTVDVLKEMKRRHEAWVQETLHKASVGSKKPEQDVATRIVVGKDALAVVLGADLFDFDHDEPENSEEMELISGFVQALRDYGDIGTDFEAGERVKVGFELTQEIKRLDEHGFYVFGTTQVRPYRISDKPINMSVAVIRIIRKTSPGILNFGPKSDEQHRQGTT